MLVLWPFEFAVCVVAGQLLAIPLLFYEQLPFSSSVSPRGLISSFVFSPKKIVQETFSDDDFENKNRNDKISS